MKGKDAQDVVISRGALDGGVSLLGSGSRRCAKLRRLPVGQRPRQGAMDEAGPRGVTRRWGVVASRSRLSAHLPASLHGDEQGGFPL
jgi:hypothetical protein